MISAWKRSLIAGGCLFAGAAPMAAQMASPTMSDATVVTRGALRVRTEMRWTRMDGVFGPDGSGVLLLGSSLTGNVGLGILPLLAVGEAAARDLAADPGITLSAGQLTTSVDSRIATVPLSAEYGLTSRITLGAMIPIVQARSVVTTQLNGKSDSSANIGTNPAAFHQVPSAYAQNAAVATTLTSAADQLAQRIASCNANPAGPGCAALAPRTAEANALIAASTNFASGVAALYGVDTGTPGSPFVPIAGSSVQMAIDARLAALRASYTSFGISGGSAALAAAQAAAANAQLQRLVSDSEFGIGLDSIGSTEQTTIGDIEVSATALLFNSFGSGGGLKLRGVVAGVFRLGTGHPARANRPYDVATGDGQNDFEVRGAIDALTGRLLTTIAGTFTVQTGSVETTRLPALALLDAPVSGSTKLGNMASVRVNPRYLVTPGLMIGAIGIGSYRAPDEVTVGPMSGGAAVAILSNDNAYTVYSGGLTIAYSNLASASGIGGPKFPAEIVYTHLETMAASAARVEKTFRDSIELRLYLRTRR